MSSAANQCLSKADSRSKKDYISRGTWNLINRRQTFFSEGDHDEVTSLYKQIKKGARADRKRRRVNQFRKCPQVTASEVTASDRK
jgi:hypothetical protein